MPPPTFTLDPDTLQKYRNDFNASSNASQQVAMNAITHTSLSKALINPQRANTLHTTFSNELDVSTKISDQKQSGRCWIFSFLNVLRAHTIHQYDLDASFEFSQTYTFFWDQFEKCNLFLHYMWELRDKPTDNEYVREMLKEPLSDGGQWHMLQNVVLKYGIVPKYCMEETYQSNNTERMTGVLCGLLREFAKDLRTRPVQNIQQTIEPMMYKVYSILCMFLGEPPQTIQWEYNPSSENWAKEQWKKSKGKTSKRNTVPTTSSKESRGVGDKAKRKGTATVRNSRKSRRSSASGTSASTHNQESIDMKPYEISKELTPLEFFDTIVQFPIEDYVTVIHYPHPDRPFHRTFTVKYLNNVVNGRESKLYNVDMQSFKTVTARSIDHGEPVWFCADVGKDISTKHGLMDPVAFDYQRVFRFDPHGWDKGQRMEYKDGVPNHAMVLRGYHQCAASNSNRNEHTEPPASRRKSARKSKSKDRRSSRASTSSTTATTTPEPTTKKTPYERWLVENSWGEYSGKDGNLVMSDEWFDRHVYEVAVHKKHLKGVWKGKPTDEDTVLEPWDVFGSLFVVR
jgi:bleomycin hydrolase